MTIKNKITSPKRILFLSYFFEPDLSAGSFRNSSLLKELSTNLPEGSYIDVVTTQPNRYNSYKVEAKKEEKFNDNTTIHRIKIPAYNGGMQGQVKSFVRFYFSVLKIVRNQDYDLVYASSSKLFTGFLGSRIARKKKAKLYLDIRDIFTETIIDVFDNSFLKHFYKIIFESVENYTFKKANHINLVSKGFESYFSKFNNCTYSYFTNGIDDVFLNNQVPTNIEKNKRKLIVYAGNIGEGQGMCKIIPPLAEALKDTYDFEIIGDGGAKDRLVKKLNQKKITNVEVLKPMNRKNLIEHYNAADFLFIHLNTLKAFERVLPSKLFDYGAFDKPIIAGVEGYAAEFLQREMPNLILFSPGNHNELVNKLAEYEYKTENRNEFIASFSRRSINNKMAKSILDLFFSK